MMHVYVVLGVYKELEFICGIHLTRAGADAQAGEFSDEYAMAGFVYEVREFEVMQ